MKKLTAAKSGTFKIGGAIAVNRLGFGAMRITGDGVWGMPADHHECLRTLEHLPIPGTSRLKHLEENVAAASIILSDAEFADLDREGKAAFKQVAKAA